jgi:fatty acid desaturase
LDNYTGIQAWLEDAAVIGLCIWAAAKWPVMYPLSALLIGARQRALATLLHEASHRTLAKNQALNKFLGSWLSGYLILQTWAAYSRSHIAEHHGKFGSSDDPDYEFHRELGLYGQFGIRELGRGLLTYGKYLVVGRLVASTRNCAELFKMTLLWCLLGYLAGPWNLLVYWLVPLLFTFGPLGFLIEVAEHWPLMPAKHPLYQTRNRASSILEMPLVGLHGERFHLVHHLYARLPMRSLKAADKYLEATWPEYRDWNSRNGGIFISSNSAQTVLSLLIRRALSKEM